jgi:hypothetical protein
MLTPSNQPLEPLLHAAPLGARSKTVLQGQHRQLVSRPIEARQGRSLSDLSEPAPDVAPGGKGCARWRIISSRGYPCAPGAATRS